jgi:hypothetical protein
MTIANHAITIATDARSPYTHSQIARGITRINRKNAVSRLRCSTYSTSKLTG